MAKILIVEDESIVAWDIKETLEKLGHNVVDLVISGAEALQTASVEHPDLVLMDIRLEGEMDGITAGDKIYHQLEIPVVYLTAHTDEITLARATRTNPFGYIIKPFQPQTLQSTIKIALQRHQLETSTRLTQTCFSNTLNSIGSGVIITDRQGLVTLINPIATALTGWTEAEAIGIQISEVFRLIWETDGTAIENPSLRAMRLKQVTKSPDRCWLLGADNLEIPISDLASPIYQPNGEVIGSIVVFQDNTEQLGIQMDLWEHNQELEFLQANLIAQIEVQTAEHQQEIACMQVLDLILEQVHTVQSEYQMLQIVIHRLGIALDADYCWITLHDRQDTARIICEYINQDRRIYPTSKIDQEIDILLYPQFYNHLDQLGCWIDPPLELIPNRYLNLLPLAAKMLICPIIADRPATELLTEQFNDQAIGEVGIITTGKPVWTPFQAHLITQILSYAVKLFRQTRQHSIDPDSIKSSLAWLTSLQADLSSAIALTNQDMAVSAQMLQQQIHAIDDIDPESLTVVEHHQFLHHELATNLQNFQAEWQRQFQLIDTLIDLQIGTRFQLESLSDIQFCQWIIEIIESCTDLAKRYQQEVGYQIPEQLPSILLFPLPILELIVLEMFDYACKYTPPLHLIILEINIQEQQLQLKIVSVGIEIPAPELANIFPPLVDNHNLAGQKGVSRLGFALVEKLVAFLGGEIHVKSERESTSLILTVPLKHDLANS